jgi:LysR family transcriptional regulator, chromosome initiation inhibitor
MVRHLDLLIPRKHRFRPMLDYSLVAAVAAVVREGSFERAAAALHITASAVSQRVKLLEERLGLSLVVRATPCTATNAGALLCRHAEQVGMLEHDLHRALPGLAADGHGRVNLRVAVNADSLATWFIGAVAAFATTERALLDISLDDQEHTAERLRSGDVLAAVTALRAPVQGCSSLPLGRMRYLAVASPAFVQRHFASGVDAPSLTQAPCLTFNQKDRLQNTWMAQQVCGSGATAPAAPRHWLPASQAFVDACRAGLGWGMNPASLVQADLQAGRLVELQQGSDVWVALHWQHARAAPPLLHRLTQAVLSAAQAALSPMEGTGT